MYLTGGSVLLKGSMMEANSLSLSLCCIA
jgi:hypothetical protein